MPELPEVETVRRRLEPALVGRRFERVEIADPRLTRPESPEVVAVASPLGWPGEDAAVGEETDEGLWSRSRDFDWGD